MCFCKIENFPNGEINEWSFSNPHPDLCQAITWTNANLLSMGLLERRTTFETPNYPRRPRDQYTAQIVNTLELSGPHQIEFKKKISNLVKFQTTNTCTYVAAKNARTVKQSHCETV